MSYIRCLSNPEGLYIWGDGKNINIAKDGDDLKYIPQRTFDGLLKKYHREGSWCVEDYPIRYRGAIIEEVFIESGKKQTKIEKQLKIKDGIFQYRLSYKNWYIDMWQVTWEHITKRG